MAFNMRFSLISDGAVQGPETDHITQLLHLFDLSRTKAVCHLRFNSKVNMTLKCIIKINKIIEIIIMLSVSL